MGPSHATSQHTRATLIRRLKNWQDQGSWQEFYDTYWRLIYGVSRKSGLTDAEAQDVVQETMLAVAKHMPTFTYDPKLGSFKAWLLNMTRWRIQDQFRKRRTVDVTTRRTEDSDPGQTSFINRVPDPDSQHIDAVWELKWNKSAGRRPGSGQVPCGSAQVPNLRFIRQSRLDAGESGAELRHIGGRGLPGQTSHHTVHQERGRTVGEGDSLAAPSLPGFTRNAVTP